MGSIIKRGSSWQVQISMYQNGIPHRETATFKTKAEAKHWERKMEIMKGNGTQIAHRMTPFPKFYSDWVYFVKKDEVRETTFQNYERSIKTIRQLFHGIQLRNLNDIIVQSKLDEYAESRAKRTTNDLLTKIKSALRYAYARGYIENDFTNILKAKGRDTNNPNKVLTMGDYKKLKDYLKENLNDEFNIYIYLILETGLRRGEALGIRPESIYKYGIKVTESISPTSEDKGVKTVSAEREVAISKEMYHLLKSIPIKNSGYLFNRGSFSQSNKLKKLIKKINLTDTTTIHGLRRTHASLAYALSLNEVHVSHRLGHKSTTTTREYYLETIPETSMKEDGKLLEHLAKI